MPLTGKTLTCNIHELLYTRTRNNIINKRLLYMLLWFDKFRYFGRIGRSRRTSVIRILSYVKIRRVLYFQFLKGTSSVERNEFLERNPV